MQTPAGVSCARNEMAGQQHFYMLHAHHLVVFMMAKTCNQYLMTDLGIGAVKKQPSQDVLHGDAAEEELGLACLVSSYTLPHQNSLPSGRGRQTARSKVLSRRARDT